MAELAGLLRSCVRQQQDEGVFIDVKRAAMSVKGSKLITRAMLQKLPQDIQAVGGVGLGAALITAIVALGSDLDGFVFRMGENSGQLEGVLPPHHCRVALVGDVLTSGEQFIFAAGAAVKMLHVVAIAVIVDRSTDDTELRRRFRGISFFVRRSCCERRVIPGA